jgi:hypothetical protein
LSNCRAGCQPPAAKAAEVELRVRAPFWSLTLLTSVNACDKTWVCSPVASDPLLQPNGAHSATIPIIPMLRLFIFDS